MTARDPSSIFAPLPEIEAACIVGDPALHFDTRSPKGRG